MDSDSDIPLLVESETILPEKLSEHDLVIDFSEKTPITILTGYLGAGKTTLLNFILKENHASGIDEAIVTSDPEKGTVEEWLDLDNGCMCCTVKDKGIKALESLAEKRGKFDYILLETTGQIASMLWTNEELGSNIKLDGIVTLVDGHNILKELSYEPTSIDKKNSQNQLFNDIQAQVAYADRIIINKIDLISPEVYESVHNELKIYQIL
ncbi:COBW domain-containing protein 1 [Smittium culicis]|uniref:COBW domain-containing protein 1 n=1 Tax=Smittium culicis TaxID=133412 RepID=A0A1R1Y3W3_9FUNG|nr:COBW domain-containing protein 1 [Smittium culicis]